MTNKNEKRNPRGVYERIPGSGVYWIRWHDGEGRRHREKAGTKSAAITLYRKRKQHSLEGRKLPELHRRAVGFGELAKATLDYCRQHHRRPSVDAGRMARLLDWWRDLPADALTPAEIETRLARPDWSDATANRYRALVSLSYRLGMRSGQVSTNPARLVVARRESNPRAGFLDGAQYAQLAAASDSLWLRTFIALAFSFGWRAGELMGLRVRQVDLAERTIRLEPGSTKNGEGRTVKLTSECFELVSACTSGKKPGDPLLTHEDGRPVLGYRWAWENACVRAGLGEYCCATCKTPGRPCAACKRVRRRTSYRYEGLLVHDLRRSAVRILVRAGVPERVAMAISGHKTRAIFDRYHIVNEADLADAARRLEAARIEAKSETQGAPEGAPTTRAELARSRKPIAVQ